MTAGSLASLAAEAPYPGVQRTVLEGNAATVTVYNFDAGGRFPVHSHPQEQHTVLLEGDARVVLGDQTLDLAAGDWFIAPPDVPHGVTAGTSGLRMIAVVSPARRPGDIEEVSR